MENSVYICFKFRILINWFVDFHKKERLYGIDKWFYDDCSDFMSEHLVICDECDTYQNLLQNSLFFDEVYIICKNIRKSLNK